MPLVIYKGRFGRDVPRLESQPNVVTLELGQLTAVIRILLIYKSKVKLLNIEQKAIETDIDFLYLTGIQDNTRVFTANPRFIKRINYLLEDMHKDFVRLGMFTYACDAILAFLTDICINSCK